MTRKHKFVSAFMEILRRHRRIVAGSLALITIEIFGHFIHLWPVVYLLYFLLVAGLMLLEHIRRTRLLHMNWLLTASWVVYRISVLVIILNLIS